MNSTEIFNVIEEVAAAKGNAKRPILAKHVDDEQFMEVMRLMLDPFITFGMAKIPNYSAPLDGVGRDFDKQTIDTLKNMAERIFTGNCAIMEVTKQLCELNVRSAELFIRIIRKDAKAGFTTNTINKVKKRFFKEFPYMRCSLTSKVDIAEEFNWELGVISQEKADGMFANVNHEVGGHITVTSRQGSPFPMSEFDEFVEEAKLRLQPASQTHGEFLVALNGEILPREKSNGVMNRILKGGTFEEDETLVFQIWDSIPLSSVKAKGKFEQGYVKRFNTLKKALSEATGSIISVIPTRIVKTVEDAYKHYAEMLVAGKEGTIIKDAQAIWKDGTSKQQVKLKLDVDVDLKVVAIQPGKVGSKNDGRAGSLTCETECGTLRVDVAVKNEKMRDHVDENPDEWLEKVIVVRSNQVLTPSKSNTFHSLFLPRMVEADYRTDKDIPDSLEKVFDQFNSAMGLSKAA